MSKSHSLLMLLAVAVLITASGAAVMSVPPSASAPNETLLLPASNDQAPACSDDALPATRSGPTEAPPGCCSTQCNTNKDCDKICGKGNCACLQQTDCCRRCVY